MTQTEIRDVLEQMINVAVNLDSINVDGDNVHYDFNHNGRNAETGWLNGQVLLADVESFEMFA